MSSSIGIFSSASSWLQTVTPSQTLGKGHPPPFPQCSGGVSADIFARHRNRLAAVWIRFVSNRNVCLGTCFIASRTFRMNSSGTSSWNRSPIADTNTTRGFRQWTGLSRRSG